jgi:hypothetical protein
MSITACPSWCDYMSDHNDPLDVIHISVERHVELALEPTEIWTDGIEHAETATAYLDQRLGEANPAIHLGRGQDAGFRLTLAEARQLAAVLIELVDTAEVSR